MRSAMMLAAHKLRAPLPSIACTPSRLSQRSFVARSAMQFVGPGTIRFFNKLAEVAEAQGHHPDIHLRNYREVEVNVTTHAAGGLTMFDFVLCSKIDVIDVANIGQQLSSMFRRGEGEGPAPALPAPTNDFHSSSLKAGTARQDSVAGDYSVRVAPSRGNPDSPMRSSRPPISSPRSIEPDLPSPSRSSPRRPTSVAATPAGLRPIPEHFHSAGQYHTSPSGPATAQYRAAGGYMPTPPPAQYSSYGQQQQAAAAAVVPDWQQYSSAGHSEGARRNLGQGYVEEGAGPPEAAGLYPYSPDRRSSHQARLDSGGGATHSSGRPPLAADRSSSSSSGGSAQVSQRPEAGQSRGGSRAGQGSRGEEAVLREMVREMREERRRLEDRMLSGDPKAVRTQDLRDELEKQVAGLARQKDALESETGNLSEARAAAAAAAAEAQRLRASLAAEQENNTRVRAFKSKVESQLQDLVAVVDGMQEQHTEAVGALGKDCNSWQHRASKLAARLKVAEQDSIRLRTELEGCRKELAAKDNSLAEVKASAEVLQAASSQMTAQLTARTSELEGKCANLSQQLDRATAEAAAARQAATDANQAARDSQAQASEGSARSDFLRQERDKLLKVLAAEQATVAGLRKDLDRVATRLEIQMQARAAEVAHQSTEGSLRQQLDAIQREHDMRISMLQQQFDAQLTAAEKLASNAHKQYDNSMASGEKLLEVHNSLRRERDALINEVESLRANLARMGGERDELASKVGILRAEVKATMDDLLADRDKRLASTAQQHETILGSLRAQYEAQLTAVGSDANAKVTSVLEAAERLKAELREAQRGAEKYRATSALLKEQLKELLHGQETLQRELAQERQVNRELNSLLQSSKVGYQ
ncbi:hypothetical protein QJQ45_001280 [Haematococcus lacustris]|nr:hypothetical protein QJQ45_001280 [Haematococcus lacustris]